jgi:hypothetical protein
LTVLLCSSNRCLPENTYVSMTSDLTPPTRPLRLGMGVREARCRTERTITAISANILFESQIDAIGPKTNAAPSRCTADVRDKLVKYRVRLGRLLQENLVAWAVSGVAAALALGPIVPVRQSE